MNAKSQEGIRDAVMTYFLEPVLVLESVLEL